jgi:hydrogenase expression/formation protein HypE
MPDLPTLACPSPIASYPTILLAHGGGGKLTHQLIESIFIPAFANPALEQRHDGATLALGNQQIAFSTDSYVVHPLFFPGGDIGMLAVNGTVNDLAMCGARPIALSVGFILEEGLPTATLQRVVASMQAAAAAANVALVTGDTKVVDRGKGDGIYINTSGIGLIESRHPIGPASLRPGDVVLVSGDIGRHGIAIMAVREGLEFETTIESDAAPLAELVLSLIRAGIEIHCLRDLTRGGLGSAVVELATAGRVQIHLEEQAIPVHEHVQGACELLGLDWLYVANEGRFICVVPADAADQTLALLRAHPAGAAAAIIGTVRDQQPGHVTMTSRIGVDRVVDMLSGEQLPRIC